MSNDNGLGLSRREVIVAGAAGLAAILFASEEAQAQKAGMDITGKILALIKDKKIELKDSDNVLKKESEEIEYFDPSVQFKGKPYIFVLGLNDCKYCDQIGRNLGKIAKEVKAANIAMPPVMLLDVLPEKDANAESINAIKEKYKENGITDFTLVFPATKAQAQLLEGKEGLNVVRNPNEDRSHGMRIALVNKKGVCVAAPLGTNAECVGEIIEAIRSPGISK